MTRPSTDEAALLKFNAMGQRLPEAGYDALGRRLTEAGFNALGQMLPEPGYNALGQILPEPGATPEQDMNQLIEPLNDMREMMRTRTFPAYAQ
jgi:hypothetical protein